MVKYKKRPPRVYFDEDGRPFFKHRGKRVFMNFNHGHQNFNRGVIINHIVNHMRYRPRRRRRNVVDFKKQNTVYNQNLLSRYNTLDQHVGFMVGKVYGLKTDVNASKNPVPIPVVNPGQQIALGKPTAGNPDLSKEINQMTGIADTLGETSQLPQEEPKEEPKEEEKKEEEKVVEPAEGKQEVEPLVSGFNEKEFDKWYKNKFLSGKERNGSRLPKYFKDKVLAANRDKEPKLTVHQYNTVYNLIRNVNADNTNDVRGFLVNLLKQNVIPDYTKLTLDEIAEKVNEFMVNYKAGSGALPGGLSSTEIDHFMNVYKPYYLGTIAADQVKDLKPHTPYFGCVMNLGASNTPGYHWVSFYVDTELDSPNGGSICYYDSFGRPPTNSFKKQIKEVIEKLNVPFFMKLKYNKTLDQRANSDSCGFFAQKALIRLFNGDKFKDAASAPDIMKAEKSIKPLKNKEESQIEKLGLI